MKTFILAISSRLSVGVCSVFCILLQNVTTTCLFLLLCYAKGFPLNFAAMMKSCLRLIHTQHSVEEVLNCVRK